MTDETIQKAAERVQIDAVYPDYQLYNSVFLFHIDGKSIFVNTDVITSRLTSLSRFTFTCVCDDIAIFTCPRPL